MGARKMGEYCTFITKTTLFQEIKKIQWFDDVTTLLSRPTVSFSDLQQSLCDGAAFPVSFVILGRALIAYIETAIGTLRASGSPISA